MNELKLKNTELVTNVTSKLIDEIESNKDYKENTKYNTTYFSVPTFLFSDNDFLDKIEKFGLHYLSFYLYLKTQMLASSSYYFCEKSLKRIIKNYCLNYNAEIDDIYKIYNDLLESKMIFCITDSKILNEPVLTDPYIIYNYLLTNNKRVYNRLKQRESRKKKKEVPSCSENIVSDFDDFPIENPDIDNIFDEIEKESFAQEEFKEIKKVSADDIPLADFF